MSKRTVPRPPTLSRDEPPDAVWAALRASGAVVLAGAAATPGELEAVTEGFARGFRVHQSPARRRYSDDDTTQGVNDGTDAIGLHAERAYLPGRPELLFFGCLVPPRVGGATTWCDGAALVDQLDPADVRELEAMMLQWRTTLDRPMWQRLLGTDDPDAASGAFEAFLDRAGERAGTTYRLDGETLHVVYRTPALSTGWISGRRAFANYLLLAAVEPDGPRATQADGHPILVTLLERVAATAEALTVELDWRRGDVAIIDNTRGMHGRRAFAGTERQILVRMGDALERFRRQGAPAC